MELNIDSSEIPEFKSLTVLRFLTLLSLNIKGSFILLQLVKKTAMIFIPCIMHIVLGETMHLGDI